MTSILIVDDQEVVREGLRAILGTVPGFEVVGVAPNGSVAVESVADLVPDVVLMDLNMPLMNGVEATRTIVGSHPEVRVLVLTTYDAEEWVLDAIRAGASGYLLKDAPRERLIDAIRGTAEGRSHVDPAVAGVCWRGLPPRKVPPPAPSSTPSATGRSTSSGWSARVSATP